MPAVATAQAEPLVVRSVRAQREALLAREAKQMAEMAKIWAAQTASLESSMDALALQIQAMRDAGDVVTPGKLYRMERYDRLLFQIRAESEKYADYAARVVKAGQEEAAWLGEQEAQHNIELAVRPTRGGAIAEGSVAPSFVQLNPAAVEGMVGIMGDGTPLRTYLQGVYGDAARGMTDYLTRAVTQGLNPRQTAREMRKGLGLGLDRALVIARTEQLRVYREAGRLTAEASGVVQEYRRLSAKQTRTCLGCLVADGKVYPVSEPFSDHPQGRCVAVYLPVGADFPQWETGSDWLAKQSEEDQLKIMGPTRHALWKEGQVPLSQMVTHTHDPLWGGSLGPTLVKDLFQETRRAQVVATSAEQIARREGIARVEAQLKARRAAEREAAKVAKTAAPKAVRVVKATRLGGELPATATREQAAAWAQERHPSITWDLKKISDEHATRIAQEIDRLAQEYPVAARRLTIIADGPIAVTGEKKAIEAATGNAFAISHTSHGTIGFNPTLWRDGGNGSSLMTEGVKSGWHASGAGGKQLESVTSHEFGHHVVIALDEHPATAGKLRTWEAFARTYDKISRYARTGPEETIAEAFAAVQYTPKAQWSESVQRFDKLLRAAQKAGAI